MLLRWTIATLAIAAAACTCRPTGVTCRTSQDCPVTMLCVSGACQAAPPVDSGVALIGPDTDCDGLTDQAELSGVFGCALDPSQQDTDGDGLRDGLETGVTAPGPDQACSYAVEVFDADPASKTSPCSTDSDGDGIHDGVEDGNANGRLDPFELDPVDPADGQGPAGQACAASNLRPVVFRQSGAADLHLAVSAGFDAASGGQLTVARQGRGLMGYHPGSRVAFVAFTEAARGGATTPLADESAVRAVLQTTGALSNVTTQTFTTWDGHRAAQAFYEQAGAADLLTRANALADALLGAGAGSLTGAAGVTGPFKLQVEYVHRADLSVVVIIALVPLARFVEPALFTAGDAAGGSALAAFPDLTTVRCEPFDARKGKVDLLFSVDDSASMPQEQQALADVAALMAQRLDNSTLDWRVAMVTTSYLAAPLADSNRSVRRGFSRDINQFRAWLSESSVCSAAMSCTLVTPLARCDSNGPAMDGRNGGCWIGAGGVGNVAAEAILGAARKAIDDLVPATAPEQVDRLRSDAQVVVVLLGDADDQTTGYTTSSGGCAGNSTCEAVQNFIKYFLGTGTTALDRNPLGKKVVVHGIACPDGQACSETQATPRRYLQVVAGTGGVGGNIYDPASIQTSMGAVLQSVIANGGHRLNQPPIGASIKLALSATSGTCNKDDVPRSRVNGFDYDGASRTISLFGACRPPAAGARAAVSYRAWVRKAAGGCAPVDCGGPCGAGLTCDLATCQCQPDIN